MFLSWWGRHYFLCQFAAMSINFVKVVSAAVNVWQPSGSCHHVWSFLQVEIQQFSYSLESGLAEAWNALRCWAAELQ